MYIPEAWIVSAVPSWLMFPMLPENTLITEKLNKDKK
jgi:hypothetical protein